MVALVFGFVLGTVLGSFSKATAERVIKGQTILGRSYCAKCKRILAWYDLFPILSYLFLKGRCRFCQRKIPADIWLAEIITGILVALVFFFSPTHNLTVLTLLDLMFKSFVVTVLAILFIIDLRTGFLPDKVTLPAIIISLTYLLLSFILKSWIFYQSFLKSPLAPYLLPPRSGYLYQHLFQIWQPLFWDLIAALGVAALFVLIIIVTRGKGMGGGDVKYVFFLGLGLGFPSILAGVFLAFLLGSVVALVLIILGKKHFGQTLPFGPFLSLGGYISLLFGDQMISWYLNNFRF